MVLASQVSWSESVENALTSIASSKNPSDLTALNDVLQVVDNTLNVLADSVLLDQPPVRRKKMEHLVWQLMEIDRYIHLSIYLHLAMMIHDDLHVDIRVL